MYHLVLESLEYYNTLLCLLFFSLNDDIQKLTFSKTHLTKCAKISVL